MRKMLPRRVGCSVFVVFGLCWAFSVSAVSFKQAFSALADDAYIRDLPELSKFCLFENNTNTDTCDMAKYIEGVQQIRNVVNSSRDSPGSIPKIDFDSTGYASRFQEKIQNNM